MKPVIWAVFGYMVFILEKIHQPPCDHSPAWHGAVLQKQRQLPGPEPSKNRSGRAPFLHPFRCKMTHGFRPEGFGGQSG